LKFGLGHFLQALFYTRQSRRFQGIRSLKPRGIAAATLTLLKRIYGSPEETVEAGRILQLQLIDHVIIGAPAPKRNSYLSFKEAGFIG
jgi:hypothetical protein